MQDALSVVWCGTGKCPVWKLLPVQHSMFSGDWVNICNWQLALAVLFVFVGFFSFPFFFVKLFWAVLINMIRIKCNFEANNSECLPKAIHFDLNRHYAFVLIYFRIFMCIRAYYLLLHKCFCHSIIRLLASKRKTLIPPPGAVRKHRVRKTLCVHLLAFAREPLYYLPQYSLLKQTTVCLRFPKSVWFSSFF